MKFNARPLKSHEQRRAALDRDLKAAEEADRRNHAGDLLPSEMGWGQRKIEGAHYARPDLEETMTPLILNLPPEGEAAWPDIKNGTKVVHLGPAAQPIRVAVIDKGMASGRPSVGIRLDLHDGTVIVAETSARLFCAAGRAIVAKYPDLFEGD